MLFFLVKFKEWELFLKVIFVIGVLLGLSMLFCYCTFLLGRFLGYARNDSSPATVGGYVFVVYWLHIYDYEVFRFCWRCTQDDTGGKEHVALSGTQVESNGSHCLVLRHFILCWVCVCFVCVAHLRLGGPSTIAQDDRGK